MKQFIVAAGVCAMFSGLGCGAELSQTTRKDIRTRMESRADTFESCYSRALTDDDRTSGDVTLIFLVSQSGKFKHVKVAKSSVNDTQLEQCVKKGTQGLRTKRGPDAPVLVTYRLRFRPQD